MNVHMRHALTHAIVDGDERPLSAQSLLHRDRQRSRIRREPCQQRGRHVDQCFDMDARNEQAMSWKQRTMIEEGECLPVLEDDAGRNVAARDLAEDAGFHAEEIRFPNRLEELRLLRKNKRLLRKKTADSMLGRGGL